MEALINSSLVLSFLRPASYQYSLDELINNHMESDVHFRAFYSPNYAKYFILGLTVGILQSLAKSDATVEHVWVKNYNTFDLKIVSISNGNNGRLITVNSFFINPHYTACLTDSMSQYRYQPIGLSESEYMNLNSSFGQAGVKGFEGLPVHVKEYELKALPFHLPNDIRDKRKLNLFMRPLRRIKPSVFFVKEPRFKDMFIDRTLGHLDSNSSFMIVHHEQFESLNTKLNEFSGRNTVNNRLIHAHTFINEIKSKFFRKIHKDLNLTDINALDTLCAFVHGLLLPMRQQNLFDFKVFNKLRLLSPGIFQRTHLLDPQFFMLILFKGDYSHDATLYKEILIIQFADSSHNDFSIETAKLSKLAYEITAITSIITCNTRFLLSPLLSYDLTTNCLEEKFTERINFIDDLLTLDISSALLNDRQSREKYGTILNRWIPTEFDFVTKENEQRQYFTRYLLGHVTSTLEQTFGHARVGLLQEVNNLYPYFGHSTFNLMIQPRYDSAQILINIWEASMAPNQSYHERMIRHRRNFIDRRTKPLNDFSIDADVLIIFIDQTFSHPLLQEEDNSWTDFLEHDYTFRKTKCEYLRGNFISQRLLYWNIANDVESSPNRQQVTTTLKNSLNRIVLHYQDYIKDKWNLKAFVDGVFRRIMRIEKAFFLKSPYCSNQFTFMTKKWVKNRVSRSEDVENSIDGYHLSSTSKQVVTINFVFTQNRDLFQNQHERICQPLLRSVAKEGIDYNNTDPAPVKRRKLLDHSVFNLVFLRPDNINNNTL